MTESLAKSLSISILLMAAATAGWNCILSGNPSALSDWFSEKPTPGSRNAAGNSNSVTAAGSAKSKSGPHCLPSNTLLSFVQQIQLEKALLSEMDSEKRLLLQGQLESITENRFSLYEGTK